MQTLRSCACDHSFPLCACLLGYTGAQLLLRSRQLSALAGWPGRVDPEEVARIYERLGGVGQPVKDCGCGR